MVERILLMTHITIEQSRQGGQRRFKRIVWIELQAKWNQLGEQAYRISL